MSDRMLAYARFVRVLLGVCLVQRAYARAGDGFAPNANAPVVTLAVQPDGKLVAGGQFTQSAWCDGTATAACIPQWTYSKARR
jgi:hypothetical protein